MGDDQASEDERAAAGFTEEQRREFREAHRQQRLEALVEDMERLRETVRSQVQRITDDSRDVAPDRAETIAEVMARTREDLAACEREIRERLRDG